MTIRFNPDEYIDNHGIKHESTFFLNNKRVLCVDEEQWEARYLVFKDRLRYWMENVPTKEITLEYLFFNGYSSNQ